MNELISEAQKAEKVLSDLKKEMFAANQDRSIYQLENFVVGQHDAPERRYCQLMTELWVCYTEIKRMLIDIAECNSKKEFGNEFEKARNDLKLEKLEYDLDAKQKEFVKMMQLKSQIKHFNMMEIEDGEKAYFEKRLTRQALEDQIAQKIGTSTGNLRAMIQAGIFFIERRVENGEETVQYGFLKSQPELSSTETK